MGLFLTEGGFLGRRLALNMPESLSKSYGRRSLSVGLIALLVVMLAVLGVAPSEGGVDDSLRRLVQTHIREGKQELENGFYAEAEKKFLMAQSYQEYLSPTGQKELLELISATRDRVDVGKYKLSTEQLFGRKAQQLKEDEAKLARTVATALTTKERIRLLQVGEAGFEEFFTGRKGLGGEAAELGEAGRKQVAFLAQQTLQKQLAKEDPMFVKFDKMSQAMSDVHTAIKDITDILRGTIKVKPTFS